VVLTSTPFDTQRANAGRGEHGVPYVNAYDPKIGERRAAPVPGCSLLDASRR
jgi:hypothetical protein